MMLNTSARVQNTSLPQKNAVWRQGKMRTAAKFFALGLLGLVLPVIPGLLLIGYALWLVFPAPLEKLWGKLKQRH
jgi:hypothetical protein